MNASADVVATDIAAAPLAFDAAGTPFSAAYGDVYHSADSGPGQAQHVFLHGNDLPSRWAERRTFVIVETGFGIGLNFLATWLAWRNDPRACRHLHFVSIERHPFSHRDLATLHARYPEYAAFAAELRAAWPPLLSGTHRLHYDQGRVTLTLVFDDVASGVRGLTLRADAFYLDGFAPDRNPAMWTPALLKALGRLAAPDATLATYTTARSVRDALTAAGFVVDRRDGFGRKRQMSAARYAPRWTPRNRVASAPQSSEHRAIVIGAGLAGSAIAERLTARGWNVALVDPHPTASAAANGNAAAALRAGILQPHISRDDCLLSRLTRAGFLYANAERGALDRALPDAGAPGSPHQRARRGVLQLAIDGDAEAALEAFARSKAIDADFAHYVNRSEACGLALTNVSAGGWWFPTAGWLNIADVIAARLRAISSGTSPSLLLTHHACTITDLVRVGDHWNVIDNHGTVVDRAPVVVLANAYGATRLIDGLVRLEQHRALRPMQRVRGQLSYLPSPPYSAPEVVVSGQGYVLPAIGGFATVGATYDVDDECTAPNIDGHDANLRRAERLLPGSTTGIAASSLGGAVGFRCIAPDRMPIVGAVVDIAATHAAQSELNGAHLDDLPRLPGLYASFAFASRGLSWTALAAESIASLIEGEPQPLERAVLAAIDPGRFVLRQLRQRSL